MHDEPGSALTEARAAVADGRYRDAEDIIRRALSGSPSDAPVLLITLADVLHTLDRYDDAEEIVRRLEADTSVRSDPRGRLELSIVGAELAQTRGNDAVASQLAEKGLASARALGEGRLEAKALEVLADVCPESESAKEEELVRAALKIVETLSIDISWRMRLLVRVADLRRDAQRFDEAEALLTEARNVGRELRSAHPVHVTVSRGFGMLRQDQGRFGEAEPYLRGALALSKESCGPNDSSTAWIERHLASLLVLLNSYDEADALLDDAQRIVDLVDGADHPTNWVLQKTRAELRTAQGRYDEAEHLYARAIRHAQSRRGAESLEVLGLLKSAALLARDRHDTDHALALYAQAQPILERFRGAGHIEFASLYAHLGDALSQDGKYAEAEAALDKAIAIYEVTVGPNHHWTLRARTHRAYAVSNQEGRAAEAEAAYAKLLEELTRIVGPEHEDVGWVLRNIGELYVDTGRWSEALSFLTRALEIYERTRGRDHPFVVWPLRLIGVVQLGMGRFEDAVRSWERALRVSESRSEDAMSLREDLADLYERVGRSHDAAALRERSKRDETSRPRLS